MSISKSISMVVFSSGWGRIGLIRRGQCGESRRWIRLLLCGHWRVFLFRPILKFFCGVPRGSFREIVRLLVLRA